MHGMQAPLAPTVKVPEAPSSTASASSPSAPSWFKAFSRAPPPAAAPMMHLQSESLVSTENTTENTACQPPEGFSRAYNGLPGDYFAVDMNSTMDSSMYDGKAKVLPLLSPAGPGQHNIVRTDLRPSTANAGATVRSTLHRKYIAMCLAYAGKHIAGAGPSTSAQEERKACCEKDLSRRGARQGLGPLSH